MLEQSTERFNFTETSDHVVVLHSLVRGQDIGNHIVALMLDTENVAGGLFARYGYEGECEFTVEVKA